MIVEGVWFIFGCMVGINNGEPRSIFQINWDRGYCGQEKVVVLEDLFVRLRSQHVNCTLGYINAISLVGACSRHARDEFGQKFGVSVGALDSNNVRLDL